MPLFQIEFRIIDHTSGHRAPLEVTMIEADTLTEALHELFKDEPCAELGRTVELKQ